ncbi:MAG: hypothetical protein FDZ75_09145, partial [Actinobacteria bacterium]
MARIKMGPTRRKLFTRFGFMGLGLGVAFLVFSYLLVSPKSGIAQILYIVMCLAGGVTLGLLCAAMAASTGEHLFSSVLKDARDRFSLQVNPAGDADEMQVEMIRLLGDVTGLLGQVKAVNADIRALTAQVLAATEEQASGAAQQAAAVTETSATVEELAQTSKQIADNAGAVAQIAELTLASAEEGMQAVADTADGIEEIRDSTQAASDRILALGERSQEIGRVLVIIDDIAEQTKILALNAAIEAARAG